MKHWCWVNRYRSAVLAVLVALVCGFAVNVPPVAAQALTGSIGGTVYDPTSAVVPGANVQLTGAGLIADRSVVTDAQGEFRFLAIPPGAAYKITVTAPGLQNYQETGINVTIGGATRVEVRMNVASVAQTETVTAAAPLVDAETSRVATNYTGTELQLLPLQRDYYDILNTTPAVMNDNLSYRATSSISGAGVRNTGYSIDGVNITDAAASYSSSRFVNDDSFEQVEVITNAIPAEIGNVSGGFVNIVTKSGGNQFHGDASFYYSSNWLQSGIPQSTLNLGILPNSTGVKLLADTSVDVGGPILKDKLWFYASYRHLNNETTGIGYQYQPENLPDTTDTGSLKLTAQVTPHNQLVFDAAYINHYQPQFTYTLTPFETPAANWYLRDRGPSGSAQWMWNPNATTIVDSRFGMFLKQDWYGIQPYADQYTVYNLSTNITTGSMPRGQHDYRDKYTYSTVMTKVLSGLGSHELKAGIDVDHFWHQENDYSLAGYEEEYTGANPSYVIFANGYPTPVSHDRVISEEGLFVQDKWKLRRFTFNLGLRFDYSNVTFPAQQYGATGVFPVLQSNPIFQPISIPGTTLGNWRNFSPRLAVAYDLTGDGKTPLRIAYSRYYDQAFTYLFEGPMNWQTATYTWTAPSGYEGPVLPSQIGKLLSTSGTGGQVTPNLKRPYWDEYLISLERAVRNNLSISAQYVYKVNHNIINWIDEGVAAGWFPVTITDPLVGPITAYDLNPAYLGKDNYVTANPAGALRQYRALQFTANQRWGSRGMAFGSVVWSQSTGNIGNDYTGTSGQTTALATPNGWVNAYGRLGLDSPLQIKTGATYEVLWGIRLGAVYVHQTGYPYTPQLRVSQTASGTPLNLGTITVNAVPYGSYRLPNEDNLNLNISRSFKVFREQSIRFSVDVFNTLNLTPATAVSTLLGSTFGKVTTIEPPRYVRLGVRYQF